MTSNEILRSDLLDILFDNRNKQYGAYALRKHYNLRLSLALGITLSLALLMFLLIKPGNGLEVQNPFKGKEVISQTIVIPKDKPKLQPPTAPKNVQPPKPVAQRQYINQIHITDNKVNTTLVDIKDLTDVAISNKDVIGPTLSGNTQPPVTTQQNSAGGTLETPAKPNDAPVQKEPEFPGGMQAWLNFLNRNLRTPGDLEAGEKKTVLIRFQVAADGAVTGFQIVQSGGSAFDNEVIRVLKKMPKWKPAIQNGEPVSRYFTQPVTFMGLEE
jgi:protein TonB